MYKYKKWIKTQQLKTSLINWYSLKIIIRAEEKKIKITHVFWYFLFLGKQIIYHNGLKSASVIFIFIKDTQYCINSGEYSDNVCEDSESIIQETLKIWDTETFCDAESLCSLTRLSMLIVKHRHLKHEDMNEI